MVIYKITNLISGKIYIGQDSKNDPKYLGSGLIMKRAIRKYGNKNFTKEIIDEANNKKELDYKEIYWIKYYNSNEGQIGYNITDGGGGCLGCKHSDESKERMSINTSGDKNPMFGKTIEEHWIEMGFSDEEIILKKKNKKEKWLNSLSGNIKSLGTVRYGKENPFYNKTHSNETKKILSDKSIKKVVLQFNLNGEFIRDWVSTMDIYRELKINCRNCCRGVSKTACGYIWKYKN